MRFPRRTPRRRRRCEPAGDRGLPALAAGRRARRRAPIRLWRPRPGRRTAPTGPLDAPLDIAGGAADAFAAVAPPPPTDGPPTFPLGRPSRTRPPIPPRPRRTPTRQPPTAPRISPAAMPPMSGRSPPCGPAGVYCAPFTATSPAGSARRPAPATMNASRCSLPRRHVRRHHEHALHRQQRVQQRVLRPRRLLQHRLFRDPHLLCAAGLRSGRLQAGGRAARPDPFKQMSLR